ncbi:hypothetical protein GC173_01350 [bacterium]|nr:hypothetical protein [bacterium]
MSSYNPSAMPPPLPVDEDQARRDEDNLRLLSILYWVWGGLGVLCGCFPIIHVSMGFAIMTGRLPMDQGADQPPPAEFGLLFVVLGISIMLLIWTMSALTIYTGFCLKARRRRTLCQVVAALACLNIPIGLALGVWTLMVLGRPSVRRLFESPSA